MDGDGAAEMLTRDDIARFVMRAGRADWDAGSVTVARMLREQYSLLVEPQNAILGCGDGVVVSSDSGRVGYLDRRCHDYRGLASGVALVSCPSSGDFLALIDHGQRALIVSSENSVAGVALPRPAFFDESVSQAWAFAEFLLVAHCRIPHGLHESPPATGLVAYVIERGQTAIRARVLLSDLHFDTNYRVLPGPEGLVVARSSSGLRNYVAWCDWRMLENASWFDDRGILAHLAPVGLSRAGARTHVLYANDRAVLASFAHPGATPRIVELPFGRHVPSALAWTESSPPWVWFNSPHASAGWAPLSGPDGRVALAPPGQLICYGPDGKVEWQYRRSGTAPAHLVEDGILVEHDAALFVLDWSGKFRHVWTAPAPITARPLFHLGSWYVSTEEGLHRLR